MNDDSPDWTITRQHLPTRPRPRGAGAFVGRIEPDEMTVPEPPIGSVIRYGMDHGGRVYTYVSLRAENGLWYTTGGGSKQNATWAELFAALKEQLRGAVELLIPHSIIWRS